MIYCNLQENLIPEYFISLNPMKPDTSFETYDFISGRSFRSLWRNAVICLCLSTNLSIGSIHAFKHAESYRLFTHQQRLNPDKCTKTATYLA